VKLPDFEVGKEPNRLKIFFKIYLFLIPALLISAFLLFDFAESYISNEWIPKQAKKARERSNIKTTLSGIYTAEKAFHVEYGTYVSNFEFAGYESMQSSKERVYWVGFVKAQEESEFESDVLKQFKTEKFTLDKFFLPALSPIRKIEKKPSFLNDEQMFRRTRNIFSSEVKNLDETTTLNDNFRKAAEKLCLDCVASKDYFKIIAVARLYSHCDLDAWTMDKNNDLKNIQNGICK